MRSGGHYFFFFSVAKKPMIELEPVPMVDVHVTLLISNQVTVTRRDRLVTVVLDNLNPINREIPGGQMSSKLLYTSGRN